MDEREFDNIEIGMAMNKAIVRYEGLLAGVLHMSSLEGPNAPENDKNWVWESGGTIASNVIENVPGEIPNFLLFLAPEGELAQILQGNAQPENYIRNGIRFLSNVTIGPIESAFDGITRDRHSMSILDAQTDHVFTGIYDGPNRNLNSSFSEAVGQHYQNIMTPKFSGAQLKMPMSLQQGENGARLVPATLSVATDKPFTHILKFGATSGLRRHIPVAEWMGLELSKRCGLETSEKALIPLPGSDAYALAVERFDIPSVDEAGKVSYYIQDMANVADIYPHSLDPRIPGKYDTPVENLIEPLRAVSSDPDADARALYKRVIFGYFLRDMDMHLKNLSILKRVDLETGDINIRFSPTYDAVPTILFPEERIFAGLDGNTGQRIMRDLIDTSMALPINGKHGSAYGESDYDTQNLDEDDFYAFAEKLGIPADEAEEIFETIGTTIAEQAIDIINNPPAELAENVDALYILYRTATEVVEEVEKQVLSAHFMNDFDYDRRFYHDSLTQFNEWYDENGENLITHISARAGDTPQHEESFNFEG